MTTTIALAIALAVQTAPPQQFATVDETVKALYASISGPAGPRDWEKFKSLFAEEGRLRAVVRNQAGVVRFVEMTTESYIERNKPFMDKEAFFESEIHRAAQQFGDVANVWSTYASRHEPGGEPFQRGINTIQMRFDGKRWWIVSILWQGETAANPLPKEYLPGG